MPKFSITYMVRNRGAIGIPFPVRGVVEAETPQEALETFRFERPQFDFVSPAGCYLIPPEPVEGGEVHETAP